MALGPQPDSALLNDANAHAINFYRWIAGGRQVTIPMVNDRDVYYRHRERFNELVAAGDHQSQEVAELFYFLNRTGFNGLCRFNRRGAFNVPFGRHSQINYRRDFFEYRTTFAGWDFATSDFESIELRRGDFIYADPAYDVDFTNYSPGGFRWEDQVRLAEWLVEHEGPVVLSNQATDRVGELYDRLGFELEFHKGPRPHQSYRRPDPRA